MIIILEGTDCSGKSSIAKKLSDRLSLTVFPENNKHLLNFQTDSGRFNSFIAGMNVAMLNAYEAFDDFIDDRFHLSEFVYSSFFKRESLVDFTAMDNRLWQLSKRKEIFLFFLECLPEHYLERARIQTQEVDYDIDSFQKQSKLFHQAYRKSRLENKFHIDTSTHDLDETCEIILQKLNAASDGGFYV